MLAVRLAQSRKIAGLSQGQLAAAMGDRYDQTMISHVETGRSGLLGDGLSEAARVLGVSIDYLLGLTDDPRSVNLLVRAAETSPNCAPDIVRIPQVAAVIGGVMYRYDDTVLYTLPFPRRWLDEQELDPKKCRLMKVGSKFMEPTLPEGSHYSGRPWPLRVSGQLHLCHGAPMALSRRVANGLGSQAGDLGSEGRSLVLH